MMQHRLSHGCVINIVQRVRRPLTLTAYLNLWLYLNRWLPVAYDTRVGQAA
jgi:hypothetical protein